MRLLLLGGTTEASALARRLDANATLSLAGRTKTPAASPLPTRIGGFGGVDGLVRYLRDERIDAVIDATHPFAAQMSAHAVAACAAADVPLAVLTRPSWTPRSGDDWREVGDAAEAAAALGETPRRVLLTVGRLSAGAFRAAPQHHYVLRSIDAPEDLPPDVEIVLARPPFARDDEIALMTSRGIEIVVSKNAGGEATRAKLDAARLLSVPVVMIRRPPVPAATTVFYDLDAAIWPGSRLIAEGSVAAWGEQERRRACAGRSSRRVVEAPIRTSVLMSASEGSASRERGDLDQPFVIAADRASEGDWRFAGARCGRSRSKAAWIWLRPRARGGIVERDARSRRRTRLSGAARRSRPTA